MNPWTAGISKWRRLCLAALLAAGACTSIPERPAELRGDEIKVVDRMTWGVNGVTARALSERGMARSLEDQLQPPPGDPLPPEVSPRIAALAISQTPAAALAIEAQQQRRAADATPHDPPQT